MGYSAVYLAHENKAAVNGNSHFVHHLPYLRLHPLISPSDIKTAAASSATISVTEGGVFQVSVPERAKKSSDNRER